MPSVVVRRGHRCDGSSTCHAAYCWTGRTCLLHHSSGRAGRTTPAARASRRCWHVSPWLAVLDVRRAGNARTLLYGAAAIFGSASATYKGDKHLLRTPRFMTSNNSAAQRRRRLVGMASRTPAAPSPRLIARAGSIPRLHGTTTLRRACRTTLRRLRLPATANALFSGRVAGSLALPRARCSLHLTGSTPRVVWGKRLFRPHERVTHACAGAWRAARAGAGAFNAWQARLPHLRYMLPAFSTTAHLLPPLCFTSMHCPRCTLPPCTAHTVL